MVRIDCSRITDWDSFHAVFADAFGFPGFYGRNMNAWIDSMSYLDDPAAGMTAVHVEPGECLTIQLDHVSRFAADQPDIFEALIDCAAFVNWRRTSQDQSALVALSYYRSLDG